MEEAKKILSQIPNLLYEKKSIYYFFAMGRADHGEKGIGKAISNKVIPWRLKIGFRNFEEVYNLLYRLCYSALLQLATATNACSETLP